MAEARRSIKRKCGLAKLAAFFCGPSAEARYRRADLGNRVERAACPTLRLAVFAGIVTPRGGDNRAEWGRGKGFRFSDITSSAPPGQRLGVYDIDMVLPINQRDALRVLAGSPGGCTESILLAHGFGIGTLHDLVDCGFATAERRTMRAERRLIGVTWLAITEAGRRALSE